MENKTIAFYIGSLGRGGAERVMINLASHFYKQNYTVYLVTKTTEDTEYEVPEGITRIIADITPDEEGKSRIANLFKRINKLRQIWKKIKPDIIVSFIRKNNLMAIASSRGLKIPVLVGIRSNPARELQGKIFKPLSLFMFRMADGIIVQTTQGKEYMPGYLRHKTVIMPNSLSKDFVGREVSAERKKEIVTVGRIDDNKNQRMLAEAFYAIKDEYPDWTLHIYGDGDRAKELSDKYAGESIIFHGQVENVVESIEHASIFVLPSRQEGMPNALIEAMVVGLACISTDCPCGGPADLIRNNENGILIGVDDKDGLIQALKKLMDDEQARKAIGMKAADISKKMAPENVNAMWQEYIESRLK